MNTHQMLMRFCVKMTRIISKISRTKRNLNIDTFSIIRKMKSLPKEGKGRDLFVILNGPSLKTQDLSVLKGKDLMFVNRGFLHPLYKELQPKYHVFVDAKMTNGTWPLSWIEDIFKMCPNIRIIFPATWHKLPMFQKYKEDKRIFWQYWTVPYYVNGVSSNCFSYGLSQGFNNIFFTGFDANSCAYDLINSSNSHFYGSDPELSKMSTKQHEQALYTTFLQFEDLWDTAKFAKKMGVNIYNMTNGGVLDMFERRDINNPYSI